MNRFYVYITLFIIWFLTFQVKAQNLFHQDIFYGGVTAGGVSTGIGGMWSTDTVSLPLYIEPGSTIRRACLFTYRIGYAPPKTIYINGIGYVFDSTSNNIMVSSHVNQYCSPVRLYYRDITGDLNSSISDTFKIHIPAATSGAFCEDWCTAFLYIEYEKPSLPKVATTVWVNDKDFTGNESYSMSGMNPIDTNYPVGLSLFTDRAGNLTDANDVIFNGNSIGLIGGSDSVNWLWSGAGVKGHFYYQNNTLYGLDDDTANSTMYKTDALADISSFVSNGATGYSLDLIHDNNVNVSYPNINLLCFNAYSTPCDTFSTDIIPDTVVCRSDSLQLFASGGISYDWLPATGLNNPNIASPYASPDSTTLYVVRIENTPGCSRTEKVLVKVNDLPKITGIDVEAAVCGNDDGSISVDGEGTNLQYSIGSGFQSGKTFNNLPSGYYPVKVKGNNGCVADTVVFVPETNPVSAFFNVTPQSGLPPLYIDINNQSSGANNYMWLVDSNFLSNNFDESYVFDSTGSYVIQLIAWNNIPQCADTFSLYIRVFDSIKVSIPNVFTPNGDGKNDSFSVMAEGSIKIDATILNRWGEVVHRYNTNIPDSPATIDLWDGNTQNGKPASEGVYYYVIRVTDASEKNSDFKGTVYLVRAGSN